MDKIYTVTFSPSIDYFVHCDNFSLGKINRTDEQEYVYPGGKGINVSVMLNNLGFDSCAMGFIAGFVGESIQMLLRNHNVKTDFIRVEGNSRINTKLRSGDVETELNGQGAHISDEALEILIEKLENIDEGSWLVLAGNIPGDMPTDTYVKILERLQYKKLHIVVDASEELLKAVLPYKPFLIKPNLDELSGFFGRKIEGKSAVFRYAEKMQEMGARNVVVSMGDKGACMVDEWGERFFLAAPKGEFINTIGSGDSLVAGFIAGCILNDCRYEEAFKLGVCAGSASAFSKNIASREEVDAFYKEIHGTSALESASLKENIVNILNKKI